MANSVFANGRELSCKAGSGKSICAFPDVCMTPPENPATPPGVPVPYPNTGMTSDCTSGSRTVKITNKEVMLKNKSYFKKSMGDEAGSAAKKGVVTSVNRGKVYFMSWSMDVKVEGENAVRHLDMTTHNHGSAPNTPPIVFTDRMALIDSVEGCDAEKSKIDEACGKPPDEEKIKCPDNSKVLAARAEKADLLVTNPKGKAARASLSKSVIKENKKLHKAANKKVDEAMVEFSTAFRNDDNAACQRALRCALVPFKKAQYSTDQGDGQGKTRGCCEGQTAEHLVPASMFGTDRGKDHPSYKADDAACMCAEGGAQRATHGLLGHHRHKYLKKELKVKKTSSKTTEKITGEQGVACGAASANKVMPQCSKGCIEAQLKKNHEDMGVDLSKKELKPVQSDDGRTVSPEIKQAYADDIDADSLF